VLLIVFLVWVVAEVAALVAVDHAIGLFWDLVLLIGVSAVGPMIVRRVGTGVLAHTRERLARGEVPTREVMDGVVILFGGALICIPGFVGDAIGLALMIGPVRHLVIRVAGYRMARRLGTVRTGRRGAVDAASRPAAHPGPGPTPPADGMLGPGRPS
jgi:UPF0716 protein FxsA